MSGFEFVFGLFSLLLGLAMAEILGGFAQMMKRHARARAGIAVDGRVGHLVPLLAAFILLNQLTFWTQTYRIQAQLPFNYVTLLGVTVIVGGYYLLSSLVWPDDADLWPDFDAYYDQHNRFILIGNLLLTIAAGVISNIFAPPGPPPAGTDSPLMLVAIAGLYGALALNIVLIFVRRRGLNAALLVALILFDVGGSIALLAGGLV